MTHFANAFMNANSITQSIHHYIIRGQGYLHLILANIWSTNARRLPVACVGARRSRRCNGC